MLNVKNCLFILVAVLVVGCSSKKEEDKDTSSDTSSNPPSLVEITPTPTPTPEEPTPTPAPEEPTPTPTPTPEEPTPTPTPTPPPDVTPPSAVVISVPSSLSITDKLSSLSISGQCEDGAQVNLSGADVQSVTCVSASFSFVVNKNIDGTFNFSIIQTDLAGNSSVATNLSWKRDTVAPSAPVILNPTENPRTSGDSLTVLSGTCETGATVNLTGSQSLSQSCSAGTFSFNLSKSTDGIYNYSVAQTDLAQNVSSTSSFQWIRNTSIPATPTISTPIVDHVYTNTTSLTISGSCVDGNTVTIGGDIIASDVVTPAASLNVICASSSFLFTLEKATDGDYHLYVYQTNASLIDSANAEITWSLDQVSPSSPVLISPLISPYTSSGVLVLEGTCESNTQVSVSGDDSQLVACPSGSFSITISESSDGTFNYSLISQDLAGNSSNSINQQWVRDSAVIPAPVITSPSLNPYLSNDPNLTISGSCDNGNTVTLSGDVLASDVINPVNVLTQVCASNSFSFTISKSADGVYNLSVKQTAGANNSPLVSQSWTRDTTVPTTTLSGVPSNPNLSLSASFVFSSNDGTATFECSVDGGAYSTCVSPRKLSSLSNTSHTFMVRARDSVGNVDASPESFTWTQEAYSTVALYHFNSGSELVDSSLYSGSNNNLITSTTATSVAAKFSSNGLQHASASSQVSQAADSSSLDILGSTMTVDFWVKFNTLPTNGNYQVLVSKSGASGNFGWEVKYKRQGSNYLLVFVGSINGTAVTETKSTACFNDTTSFHHVAVTFNQGAVKFYCDGVAKGSGTIGTVGTAALFNNNADLRIGRDGVMGGTDFYFNGIIDELRLSQTVRWSSGFTVPASAYVAD